MVAGDFCGATIAVLGANTHLRDGRGVGRSNHCPHLGKTHEFLSVILCLMEPGIHGGHSLLDCKEFLKRVRRKENLRSIAFKYNSPGLHYQEPVGCVAKLLKVQIHKKYPKTHVP